MSGMFSKPEKPKPLPPPVNVIREDVFEGGNRKMPKPAIFASDEELKLGIAGKLGG